MNSFFANKFDLNQINNTPCIILSAQKIIESFNFFRSSLQFNSEEIFYPVKVNYNINVINLFKTLGCGFEVGAISEIELLIKAGINPKKIIFGNPIKSISTIQNAYNLGIRRFCADHKNEILKLAKHAPKSEIYFRLSIDNYGAEWKLTHKFGCNFDELQVLFETAIKHELKPIGISFHIGWNNDCIKTWKKVFEKISNSIQILKSQGVILETINIGGGFPSHNKNQFDLLTKISAVIVPHLQKWKNQGIKVLAEPGSFLLANSGVLVVSVIECVRRNGINWVFVDSGIFQGFYWILSGLKYSVSSSNVNTNELEEMIVCGPTCDSHDVFAREVLLPKTIKIGDKLFVHPAGAYINSAQKYNGFDYPVEVVK